MTDNVDEFLAHHGVLGMHWGHHSATGGGSSSSPRSQAKVAKLQNKVAIAKSKQKESDTRDKTIVDARKNVEKTASQVALAKKQYKVDKITKGKAQAKATLNKVKDMHMTNVYNANLSTAKELVDQRNTDFWDSMDRYANS